MRAAGGLAVGVGAMHGGVGAAAVARRRAGGLRRTRCMRAPRSCVDSERGLLRGGAGA